MNPHVRKCACSRCGAECWNVVAIGMYAACLDCFREVAESFTKSVHTPVEKKP